MNKRFQRTARVVVALVVISVIIAAFSTQPAYACDFEPPPPPSEALDEATAVFSGEVVEMTSMGDDEFDRTYEVRFAVSRVWKGVETASVVVETHADEGVCGFPFEVGERYLVYAHGDDDELNTALYHRTAHWDRADNDLEELGEGTPVEQVIPIVADEDSRVSLWMLAGLVGIVSGVAAVVILIRRAKARTDEEDWENMQ